jgi:hypothetical protein
VTDEYGGSGEKTHAQGQPNRICGHLFQESHITDRICMNAEGSNGKYRSSIMFPKLEKKYETCDQGLGFKGASLFRF